MEKNNLITKKEFDFLFSQIVFITGVNKKLYESFEQKVDVGQAFLTFGPYLLGYSTYCNNFNQIKKMLEDKKIVKIIKELNSNRKKGTTNFDSHMILPIQRIPRYILLLDSIHALTSPLDKDYPKLEKALPLIKKVMDEIDLRNKESTQKIRVKEISDSIKNCPLKIIAPARNFIYEEEIIYVDGKQNIKGNLILFNDMLIMIDLKNNFLFEVVFNTLPEVQIFKDPDNVYRFGVTSSLNKTYIFETPYSDSKLNWIDLVEVALSDQQFLEAKYILEISQDIPSAFNMTKMMGEVGTSEKGKSNLEMLNDITKIQSSGLTHSISLIGKNINNQSLKKTRSRKSIDFSDFFKKKQ